MFVIFFLHGTWLRSVCELKLSMESLGESGSWTVTKYTLRTALEQHKAGIHTMLQ